MDFVALDLETTGLNPHNDHIIEVAIVRFDEQGKILDEWSSLVKPSVSIPSFTTRLTGIDNPMVKDAPKLDELRETILNKIGNRPIVGHYIFFDVNFLNQKGFDFGNEQLDTCQLAQVLFSNEPSYSLEVLVKKLNIDQPGAHRALNDVLCNIKLMSHLLDHIASLSDDQKTKAEAILTNSEWPWRNTFMDALQKKSDLKINRTKRNYSVQTEAKIDLKTLAPKPPFLIQESTHNNTDLLNYALQLDAPTLLVVPDLKLCPVHENALMLKNPTDYVSPERLELFTKEKGLSGTKTMLALKVGLELSSGGRGEKSDFRLFKEENDAWFDICGQDGDPGEIYMQNLAEAEKKQVLMVSQHHFLSTNISRPHIVSAETESWLTQIEYSWHFKVSEHRLLASLLRLKKENPTQTETLDELAGQVSIFFGFMGMALRKYGESNDMRHQWNVQNHERNTMEWNKVTKSIQSIEHAWIALQTMLSDSPAKDEMQKLIETTRKLIETEGPVLWITLSAEDQLLLHSFPENTPEIFKEKVWSRDAKWHLFAHQADLSDEFKFTKNQLSLPEDFKTETHGGTQNWPLYWANPALPSPNDPSNVSKVTQWIDEHWGELNGDVFLLLSAKHTAEQFFYSLAKLTQKHGVKLFVQNLGGGMGKILKMSEESRGHNLFVGNSDFLQFLLNEDTPLKTLIVQRLPFSHPNDPIHKARTQHCNDAYSEFALPYMKLQNHILLDHFLGSKWEAKAIHMLDSRG